MTEQELRDLIKSTISEAYKELDEESKTVYIWTKVLESNMMKAREYIENLKQTKDRKDIDQDRDQDKN